MIMPGEFKSIFGFLFNLRKLMEISTKTEPINSLQTTENQHL